MAGEEEEENPRDDGLESLGQRAAKVKTSLRQAFDAHPLKGAGEGQKEAAVQVVGEEALSEQAGCQDAGG